MAGSKYGLMGVLEFMRSKFVWGAARKNEIGDISDLTERVDCIGQASIALGIVYDFCVDNRTDITLATIQLVKRADRQDIAVWNTVIEDMHLNRATESELEELKGWLIGDYIYHQCIGLISPSGVLTIWDNNGDILMPPRVLADENVILAIQVTPFLGNSWQLGTLPHRHFDWLQWEHVPVPTSKWVRLNDSSFGDLFSAARAVVSTVVEVAAGSPDEISVPLAPTSHTVLITGCHMSPNPCPGVGIARSLRAGAASFPALVSLELVAVDNNDELFSGMSDPVFDSCRSLIVMSPLCKCSLEEKWTAMQELLQDYPSALLIPNRDSDVEAAAYGLAAQSDSAGSSDAISDRVLSCSEIALASTLKPDIPAAVAMGCFKIPEFMLITDSTTVFDVKTFCDNYGYPVGMKGATKGACMCFGWYQVLHQLNTCLYWRDGFVQRFVPGLEAGIAFAAHKGELLGCMQMVKSSYTVDGKVFSGKIDPVPVEVESALRRFVSEVQWTGGGEIEFVMDIVDKSKMFAIDFNPRFPAWIFASTLADCNLPAKLVAKALGVTASPERDTSTVRSVEFQRSIIEVPVANINSFRRTPYLPEYPHGSTSKSLTSNSNGGGSNNGSGMTSNSSSTSLNGSISSVPSSPREGGSALSGDKKKKELRNSGVGMVSSRCGTPVAAAVSQRDWFESPPKVNWTELHLTSLCQSSKDFITLNADKPTPYFILSKSNVENNLNRQKSGILQFNSSGLAAQLCLSVKTQPSRMILQAALKNGYFAEVISVAEMRASLSAGFRPEQIVLTGPGKFWDNQPKAPLPKSPLHAIFADSIADLRNIVDRLLDPEDWLDTETIGVRFSNPGNGISSRFGIECNDLDTLETAALLISKLPEHIHLGVHFHFASSTTGVTAWFGMASAFVTIADEFGKRCFPRKLGVIDFGGGWNFHILEESKSQLTSLFKQVGAHFNNSYSVPTIQFEPGKSISESAGGVICKVLCIREVEWDAKGAAVVDVCVGELSSPHGHPVFWLHDGLWQPLQPGNDQLWGRSCMEFDIVAKAIQLPEELAEGDYLLFGSCGAYDMSMNYPFGDGIERDISYV